MNIIELEEKTAYQKWIDSYDVSKVLDTRQCWSKAAWNAALEHVSGLIISTNTGNTAIMKDDIASEIQKLIEK